MDFNGGGWRERAVCQDYDPDWWFPAKHASRTPETVEAKRICVEECPVRQQCLAWALVARPSHGIWGGESTATIDRIRSGTRWHRKR